MYPWAYVEITDKGELLFYTNLHVLIQRLKAPAILPCGCRLDATALCPEHALPSSHQEEAA
jgi:hypothetical protein